MANSNTKIEIEEDLSILLSPNKKRVVILKKKRRIYAAITLLKIASENRENLDAGENITYDFNWSMKVEDWSGEDYVCFQKLDERDERVG